MVRKVVAASAFAILMVLAWAGLAAAQGTESVTGFVRNEVQTDGTTTRDPVAGVRIVFAQEGVGDVGTATTDDAGKYDLPLPAPGNYTATIDESSFPDDVTLRSAEQKVVSFPVRPEEAHILNYTLGADTRTTETRWDILPQTIFNGLKFGLIIAVCAVGLSLIYGTTGLSNFAQGELVTLGAIVAWWVNQRGPKLHILLAAVVGVAVAALAGAGMEKGVWKPLRRRGVGLTSMMIVSIGIGIAARYVYQYLFGARSQSYRQYSVQRAWEIGPIDATPRNLITMTLSLLTLVAVALFLQRTRSGKAVRAVSDNPDLSSATGINTDRVLLIVWVVSGALAGFGGILLALDEQVKWDTGFGILLLMFAAITLGGLGNPYGALVGGVVIGLVTELWTWFFPSVVELKYLAALAALILILLVRPQGILGRKERVG